MKIGVDYYPEHWDKSLWQADADLMLKTGVKLVRLGEFAWCKFEPREGEFDFSMLDEAIDMFAQRGIGVVLCTPTNCPPLWLYEKYPEAVQTGRDGQKIATGIRGHRCLNSPDFLRYAKRIVDVMSKRYADNSAVAAWQIDNELEANFCMCESCTAEYRNWLKEKYGSLEALNKAYGNNVWSGEYSSWEQIKPPFGSYPYAWLNPAYMLDFYRCASDGTVKYLRMQADIIRKNCPGARITTNTWFCENMPDFYNEFKTLDFVSFDNYPTTKIPVNPGDCYSHAFHLDLMRGIKRDNFWIMEQLSGAIGSWAPMSRQPFPGMIEGYSLQALAHGADTVIHFRWRTAVTGAEMHWHGLIDHSNLPGRRFAEFEKLCKTAETLGFVEGTSLKSQAAVIYSPENEWAFKIQPQTDGMYYFGQLKLLHDGFVKHGLNVDVIPPDAPLDGYKIIAAPQMYVTDGRTANRLCEFARNGGTLILTNRSGVKDEHNNCITAPLPTVFREAAGAYVEEYNPIGWDKINVRFSGEIFECGQWCDILAAETAEPIAFYESDYFAGKPAATVNRFGKGRVYYVGTVGERSFYHRLIRGILDQTGTDYIAGLPDNVEITTRTGEGKTVRFIFNNTNISQTFELDGQKLSLAPFEMKIQRIN